jgi:hypothetical protein
MNTDSFCFYLQNRLIQTRQTGGQWYSGTFTMVLLVFPANPLPKQGGRVTTRVEKLGTSRKGIFQYRPFLGRTLAEQVIGWQRVSM